MTDRIVEVQSNGAANGALILVAVILVMVVTVAVLYFAGVFKSKPEKHEIDININKPGIVLQLR